MSTVAIEAALSATISQPALPALRLLLAPACEPPYDDEHDALPNVSVLRLVPPVLVPLTLVPPITPVIAPAADADETAYPTDTDTASEDDEGVAVTSRRTATLALPSPHRFSHALLQRLLEVFAGVRPLAQLQRNLSWEAYEELERCYAESPRTLGPRPTARAVHSVHVQARPEGVAEVCASVDRGGRRVALALRLEGHDGAWRCTDLVGV